MNPPQVTDDKTPLDSSSPLHNPVDALLVLRAFACLMVVAFHCSPPRNSILFHGVDLSWLTLCHGGVAVWIFFCLSGYLMGKAFYSGRYRLNWHDVLNFWRNRALRVLPLYGFTVLVLSIFVYPEILKLENWGILLRIFTFTYDPWLSSHLPLSFNGVLWSLSTEVQFYLCVPFVYAILDRYCPKRRHVWLTIAVVLLTVFIFRLVIWTVFHQEIIDKLEYAARYWATPLVTNLDIFLIGFLMNPLIGRSQQPTKKHTTTSTNPTHFKFLTPRFYKLLAISLIILLYLFTAHHFYHQELRLIPERADKGFRTTTTIFILQPLTALVTAYFIFAFEVKAPSTPPPKLSPATVLQNPWRCLEVFGHLSYGVYLWHMPIILKIAPIFTSAIPIEAFYLRLQATLILSLILSTVTYYTIELPAARWKIYRYPKG